MIVWASIYALYVECFFLENVLYYTHIINHMLCVYLKSLICDANDLNIYINTYMHIPVSFYVLVQLKC